MTPNDRAARRIDATDYVGGWADAEIVLAGVPLWADPFGGLFCPATETLIVSDLHLEKGAALARRGAPLPAYDTAATLARLATLLKARQPRRVVALGDSFHDAGGPDAMGEGDAAMLASLVAGREWIWVCGNHDPEPTTRFGGVRAAELRLGPLTLRHEPTRDPRPGEIAGHLHPVARVQVKGRTLRRRCFATDGDRMVTPAFGAFAGGLNVRDAAFVSLFAYGRMVAWALGAQRLYRLSGHLLIAD